MDLSDLNSYLQLIQDIIGGTVRRHTFNRMELDLLLDVQSSHVRKTAKNELLRRYLRSVQQQSGANDAVPLRFARFSEDEGRNTRTHQPQRAQILTIRTATTA